MSKNHWKLTDEEYEFIKGEVIHIFEIYNIKCMPVSGFEIASKMKITLIAYSSLTKIKLKTAMKASEDGFFIECEGRDSYERIYKYKGKYLILSGVGTNGFIVSAYPTTKEKL